MASQHRVGYGPPETAQAAFAADQAGLWVRFFRQRYEATTGFALGDSQTDVNNKRVMHIEGRCGRGLAEVFRTPSEWWLGWFVGLPWVFRGPSEALP